MENIENKKWFDLLYVKKHWWSKKKVFADLSTLKNIKDLLNRIIKKTVRENLKWESYCKGYSIKLDEMEIMILPEFMPNKIQEYALYIDFEEKSIVEEWACEWYGQEDYNEYLYKMLKIFYSLIDNFSEVEPVEFKNREALKAKLEQSI